MYSDFNEKLVKRDIINSGYNAFSLLIAEKLDRVPHDLEFDKERESLKFPLNHFLEF